MQAPRSVLFIVLLLLLAGCGSRPPPTSTSTGPSFGTVEGRVLDDAQAVVVGATVRVLLTRLTVNTDAEGAYRIERVPAGPIRVVASAEGFTSQTKSTILSANGNALVNFVLTGVPVILPYHETIQFSDTITCGLPVGTSCPSDPQADPEQTSIVHAFEVAFDLRGLVFELNWAPPASGVNANLAFDVHAASPDGCGARYNGALGPSTLRLEVLEGFPVSGGHQCVAVRPPGNQVTGQQTYTMYVTMFYHDVPPPGFSALG